MDIRPFMIDAIESEPGVDPHQALGMIDGFHSVDAEDSDRAISPALICALTRGKGFHPSRTINEIPGIEQGRSRLITMTENAMNLFISWSGRRSRTVAAALHSWLRDVFQDVETWMSAHDLEAGANWGARLAEQLESTSFGILCLTPENLNAPWLLFEAGALSKLSTIARVIPFRIGLRPTDVDYPLAQFQSVDADAAGARQLLESINKARPIPLSAERLSRLFEKWWPDLKAALDTASQGEPLIQTTRSDRALLEEILENVRAQNELSTISMADNVRVFIGRSDDPNARPNHEVSDIASTLTAATIGTSVRHNQFGNGRVVAAEGRGPFAKVTVNFDNVGLKRVIAKFLTPSRDTP